MCRPPSTAHAIAHPLKHEALRATCACRGRRSAPVGHGQDPPKRWCCGDGAWLCACVCVDRAVAAHLLVAGLPQAQGSGLPPLIAYLNGVRVKFYEPTTEEAEIEEMTRVDDLASLKQQSDIILANRLTDELADVKGKVFSRDLFNVD